MFDQRFFYSAKVLSVVDGDTFDCMIDLGFSVHLKARIRLYGINTPESRTKDLKEKEMGLKAKEFTKDWLTRHTTIYVRTVVDKNEKYGRVLAEVYSSPNTDDPYTARLNTDIIQAGYAREYFGVGDKTWTEFKNK
jgi:micrococcal nuclease